MCFAPWISISTAILEFIIATIILLFFRCSLVNKFFAFFIYLLGFYQFTEFMLCTTKNVEFWVTAGFIAYTFLPALGLHFVMKIAKNRFDWRAFYCLPIIFATASIASSEFVISTDCSGFFVLVKTLFFSAEHLFVTVLYWTYYFVFIALSVRVILKHLKKENNRIKDWIDMAILAGIFLSIVPAVILFTVMPALGARFPSIYCQFAVVFAIVGLITAYLDHKLKKSKDRIY